MKYITSSIGQFLAVIALAAVAALAMPLSAQVDTDEATGVARVMVVDNVNAEAGTVTLNGDIYRISNEKRPSQSALSPNGRALKLSDLEPGMEVLVLTDGTMPSDSHQPRLKGIWVAR